MSKYRWIFVLIAASLVLVAGCKSSTTPPPADSFVGTWHATKAEFTSVADPGTKVDIVAQGGSVTLVIEATTAVMTITKPGEDPLTDEASWSASSDVFTLTWTSGLNGEAQFDYALNGDNLTLEGGHFPFDFTPGDFVESTLDLILVRQ
jgi:hypothetical protein